MKLLNFLIFSHILTYTYSFKSITYHLNLSKNKPLYNLLYNLPIKEVIINKDNKLQNLYPIYYPPIPPIIFPKSNIPPIPPIPPVCHIFSIPPKPPIKNKFLEILKLIRAKNIVPTLFLCFSGGWLMNPSLTNLLQSQKFIVYTINTILIMSASMVINDLYDIEIDKINNPERPLVKGTINKLEAIGLTFILLGISEYLSLNFLPISLQNIIHSTIIYVNLYTPIFKKILVIKNISCAAIVSISLFFAGLASCNIPLVLHPNFNLLLIATNLIFTGSWSNEIILDIHDYEGDKKQKILTLPTILGKETSLTCTGIILYLGSIMNIIALANLYNYVYAYALFILFLPQFYALYDIKKYNYSNDSIQSYMKKTDQTLLTILLYISALIR
jgi:geranylgeranylglycerol-phosphate geranylgeranyltransferase